MNIRLTILLAVIAIMIASTWAVIEFTDLVFREEREQDEPWLFHIDEGDITFIEVSHGGRSVQYARDPAGYQWTILGDPDYPVFFQKWGGTPLLLSGPRVNRGLSETIGNPAEYGLDPPETIVRVADYVGNEVEFHMGIPTPDGDNQYARLVGDDALYSVPASWAFVVNRLALDPPYGRLFDLEIGEITVVEVNAGKRTAVYYVDIEGWFVHPGPQPVSDEASAPVSPEWANWLQILAAPRVDEIADQQVRETDEERLTELGLYPPEIRIVIARRNQPTVEIQLSDGPPGSDAYYARTINTNDEAVYLIKKSRFENVETLATDPLADPDWEPPDPSSVQNGEGGPGETTEESGSSN